MRKGRKSLYRLIIILCCYLDAPIILRYNALVINGSIFAFLLRQEKSTFYLLHVLCDSIILFQLFSHNIYNVYKNISTSTQQSCSIFSSDWISMARSSSFSLSSIHSANNEAEIGFRCSERRNKIILRYGSLGEFM